MSALLEMTTEELVERIRGLEQWRVEALDLLRGLSCRFEGLEQFLGHTGPVAIECRMITEQIRKLEKSVCPR